MTGNADARARVLDAVRAAVRRDPAEAASRREEIEARIAAHEVHVRPAVEGDLAARFAEKAALVSTSLAPVAGIDGVSRAVADYLEEHRLDKEIVVTTDPLMERVRWSNEFAVARRAAEPEDRVSVTGAYAGIAETGTVVFVSDRATPTTLNFLPETHVAVLARDRLVAHSEDVWARLGRSAPLRRAPSTSSPGRRAPGTSSFSSSSAPTVRGASMLCSWTPDTASIRFQDDYSTPMIPFSAIVRELPATIPFVGPEAIERRVGRPFDIRIGANESAFGVSPRAAEAMREAIGAVSWYGDPEGHDLRAVLAEHHGVEPGEVCLGAGIDELLGFVVRMLTEPGTPVVTSAGAYPTFNYHVSGAGGRLVTVPYRDDHEDPDALAEAVRDTGAPLVYFANPDNPMGTWHGAQRVRAFIEALPENVLLALDEAYMDFARDGTDWPMAADDPRVLRLRTFSKAHGMAGARIGYCVGHRDLVTGLNKIRNHFGVNRIAQAGALASLRDREFVAGVIAEVAAGREEYARLAESLGLVLGRIRDQLRRHRRRRRGSGPRPPPRSSRRAASSSACRGSRPSTGASG